MQRLKALAVGTKTGEVVPVYAVLLLVCRCSSAIKYIVYCMQVLQIEYTGLIKMVKKSKLLPQMKVYAH